MRCWPVTLLCAATGCAQIFGLDVTTGGPDANQDRTSIELDRVSIGATLIKNPYDLTGGSATWYTDDGAGGYTTVPGEYGPAGTFTAPILTGTPPVSLVLPGDTVAHFYALPARAQRGLAGYFEHPNPTPAAPTSQIHLTATLPTPYVGADSFQMFVVGAWTQHGLPAAELPAPDMGATTIDATVNYSAFTDVFGRMPTSSIIASDVVLLLRYTSGVLSGVLEAQFDQTSGADPVSGTVTPVGKNDTLNVPIDPAGYATRYSAVRPAVTGLGMQWRLAACPGASIGVDAGGVTLTSGGASMTNTAIMSPAYGNPFESLGWKTLLTFVTSSSRSYSFNGATIPLGSQMVALADPAASPSLDFPVGLPITVRANLTPLTTDGMNVMLDLTKPVTIDAIVDKPTATNYSLSVYELEMTGTTTAVRKLIADSVTTGEPTIKLPQELFQVGKTYVVQFRATQGGYTNAAMGDLQTVTLPLATATLDSAVFTVVAP